MQEIIYIIVSVVSITVTCLQWLMIARMLLSFLPLDGENALIGFVFSVTEPLIFPIRSILERFEFFANSPFDFSAMFSYYILMIIGMFL